jgi:hypothetical protein
MLYGAPQTTGKSQRDRNIESGRYQPGVGSEIVLRPFENLTLPTSTKSYSTSDQYSVAIIHSAYVFVGQMSHHTEVRCQLVALKDTVPLNSKLSLSDYDVRAWVNRVPRARGRGTRPASGTLDNDQIAPQNCPWFLVRHASRKCIKGNWKDFGMRTALLRITGGGKQHCFVDRPNIL